jgi:hypothetical protein
MTERKIRVVVAKPGLSPEGGCAPLPDLPQGLRRRSRRSNEADRD